MDDSLGEGVVVVIGGAFFLLVAVGAAIARWLDDAETRLNGMFLRLGIQNERVRSFFAIVGANLLGWCWGIASFLLIVLLVIGAFVFIFQAKEYEDRLERDSDRAPQQRGGR
jgi:hypothetical protein